MINENEISTLSVEDLLSEKLFNELYDITDIIERERMVALLSSRAKQLQMKGTFDNLVKVHNRAERQMQKDIKRNAAVFENNVDLPLEVNKDGQPKGTRGNLLLILRSDTVFNNIRFNLLTNAPEKIINGTVERWTDTDDSKARVYIEEKYKIQNFKSFDDALNVFLNERPYHPIKDIIEATEWDGTERINTLLIRWLCCEDTPYTREVSRLIFAGGIHRLYNPGCKFDIVPVLIGTKQGEGKSTFVRKLAVDEKYFVEVTDIDNDRGMEILEGAWICEIAELLAMTRTKEKEAIKAYLSKQSDRGRRKYKKWTSDIPRQCIFIGTTNNAQFLTDKTGNRRFYPVTVHQNGRELFNRMQELEDDIIQCWAEAKAKYDVGELPPVANFELDKEIRQMQSEAMEDDYRVGLIMDYLEHKEETCIIELWEKALKEPDRKPTRKDSNDIAQILISSGEWERTKTVKTINSYGGQKIWKRISARKGFHVLSDETELPDEL